MLSQLLYVVFTYFIGLSLAELEEDVKRAKCDNGCGIVDYKYSTYSVGISCYNDEYWLYTVYSGTTCDGGVIRTARVSYQLSGCDCADIGFLTQFEFDGSNCDGEADGALLKYPLYVNAGNCGKSMPYLRKCKTESTPHGIKSYKLRKLTGCAPFGPFDEDAEQEGDYDDDYDWMEPIRAIIEEDIAAKKDNEEKIAVAQNDNVAIDTVDVHNKETTMVQQMLMTVGIPVAILSSAGLLYAYGKWCIKNKGEYEVLLDNKALHV